MNGYLWAAAIVGLLLLWAVHEYRRTQPTRQASIDGVAGPGCGGCITKAIWLCALGLGAVAIALYIRFRLQGL